ncbi:major facilitator superfamily domain-containing protein [Spinellus fusiger]|nr:major facilitator superfamily domain-containing protein [Spinellus fusiger]
MQNSTEHTGLLEEHHRYEENITHPHEVNSNSDWIALKKLIRPLIAANFMSILVGLNDGNIGMIIPQFKDHYGIPDETVSLLFLFNASGFMLSAAVNGLMVKFLGQRATLYIGSFIVLAAYILLMQGFEFWVACMLMTLLGCGIALLDSGMNVFAANVPYSTVILSILHAVYGIGAMISPLVGAWIMANDLSWKGSFIFLTCAAILNLILITIGFRNISLDGEEEGDAAAEIAAHGPIKEALLNRMTMTGAIYILVYVGLEVTLGDWGFTFLTEGRGGERVAVGRYIACYWLGLATGRILLGYAAGRYGEKYIITLCTVSSGCLLVLLCTIKNVVFDSIVFILLGFLLGPMFPTTIGLASKMLPRWMHASSIGFIASFGAGGSALFPFIIGQMSGKYGITSMPLVCLIMVCAMQFLWAFVPSDRPMFSYFRRNQV